MTTIIEFILIIMIVTIMTIKWTFAIIVMIAFMISFVERIAAIVNEFIIYLPFLLMFVFL